MKLIILYHPKSEHEGLVMDYAHELKRFKDKEPELLSLDSIRGADMAKLYDIVRYPAILVIADDGHLQNLWQGLPLPLMDEVDAYLPNYDAEFAKAALLTSSFV